MTVCSRCICDSKIPNINFDENNICNYCHENDKLKKIYGTGLKKGQEKLEKILKEIKTKGKNKKYDCVVGVSGGTDSSYLLYLAKIKWGLKPLAVHYDNTWNSAIASVNISKILKSLDIDLYTHVVNNKEADDIFKSFFLAGVPEIEASTDLGYAFLLRKIAAKYSIKFILEGHSFVNEGIAPLGKNYFDGRYIKDIHKKFGTVKMQTYPLMTFNKFLKSIIIDRVKFIRPFWYINYSKEEARKFLKSEFNWNYYGGHHLENRMSAFLHKIYLPQKYNMDMRNFSLASLTRNGMVNREVALSEYNLKPNFDLDLVIFFKKRLGFNDYEYNEIMLQKPRYWQNFKTYKKYFTYLSPLFYFFMKLNLVTDSFYIKYCLTNKNKND